MYLTRIPLDLSNEKTYAACSNPEIFHAALVKEFEGEDERLLWRLDEYVPRVGGGDPPASVIWLVSRTTKSLHCFMKQFGLGYPETRNYDPLLDRLQNGDIYHFQFKASPSTSRNYFSRIGGGDLGEQLSAWLFKQGAKHGFEILDYSMVSSKTEKFFHAGGDMVVTFPSVTWHGQLQITDVKSFVQALTKGIGREKAYGQGLLTISPALAGVILI